MSGACVLSLGRMLVDRAWSRIGRECRISRAHLVVRHCLASQSQAALVDSSWGTADIQVLLHQG